jgi:hypothetical protein
MIRSQDDTNFVILKLDYKYEKVLLLNNFPNL